MLKEKYIEMINLILSNPANKLTLSSIDMLTTIKAGLRLDIIKNKSQSK